MGNPYWKKLIEGIADTDACYGVHMETIGPDELDEEQRFLYLKELLVNLRKDMEEYYEDSTNWCKPLLFEPYFYRGNRRMLFFFSQQISY